MILVKPVDAAFSTNTRKYKVLRTECWEEILKLLSGKAFYLEAEHWPAFVELVNWHHILIDVLPTLSSSTQSHEFNEQQLKSLDQKNLNLRKKALTLSQAQNQISEYFSETGIRHLFFKGTVLSHWLYGSATARQCRDIDVVVHPLDHAMACTRLEEMGCMRIIPKAELSQQSFKRYCSAMKDVTYLHQASESLIELHWALRPFPEAFEFDFDSAYESRKVVETQNTAIPVFSDLLHARYIAAHGCLSHWGRVRWLLDWQQLSIISDIDWPSLLNSTALKKEAGYIKKAFLLANRQLDLSIPEPFDSLKPPFASQYCIQRQAQAHSKAEYPNWLKRQILNLANQQDLKGMAGYSRYMLKKLMAANTLK